MSVSLPAALQTQNLVLGYQRTTIIDQLNASIPHGQVTAIIGPNGCGKSTLLAGLAKLHPAKQGQILLDGQDIAVFRRVRWPKPWPCCPKMVWLPMA